MTPDDVLASAPLSVSLDEVATVLTSEYGIGGAQVVALPGDRDRNFAVHMPAASYMLKIAHQAERTEVLTAQQQVLDHISLWDPTVPVPRAVPTRDGKAIATISVGGAQTTTRLTTFIPGITVEDYGWTPQLRRATAETVAKLGLALRSFDSAELGAPELWQIENLAELRPQLEYLEPERRNLAAAWLDHYEAETSDRLPGLRSQTIHGDFNPANLLVDPDTTGPAGGCDRLRRHDPQPHDCRSCDRCRLSMSRIRQPGGGDRRSGRQLPPGRLR